MKKRLKFAALGAAIPFALFAFIQWEINPGEWGILSRALCIFWMGFFAFLSGVSTFAD